jgi:hypothetical protein
MFSRSWTATRQRKRTWLTAVKAALARPLAAQLGRQDEGYLKRKFFRFFHPSSGLLVSPSILLDIFFGPRIG